MTPASVTTKDLRSALKNVCLAASCMFGQVARRQAKSQLLEAIKQAHAVMDAADEMPQYKDADALIRAYIAAGGNWQELVAAVQRHSLEGSTRRRAA